jgi:exosortase A-associated hydrolase 2
MKAFFLDAGIGGQRFCIHYPAQGPLKRGQVLFIHPFAEEMNKSRRVSALLARALAQAGHEVLQIDLHGCGDSSGDFGDAGWDGWVGDVLLGCRWLQGQPDPVPLWLCGLRAGCLLAAEALRRLDTPANLLLLQPPAAGKPLLQQFLRLKLAGDMADGRAKGLMAELRAALARGETIEIAGYALSAALAQGLEAATLQPPGTGKLPLRLVWLELSARADAEWTPAALQSQQRWSDAGHDVGAELLCGPSFWQTAEIEEAPALVEAACRRLTGASTAGLPGADRPQAVAA